MLNSFFALNMVIFTLGIIGLVINRKNIIILLMAIELALLAVNFDFIAASIWLDDLFGLICAVFILTIAAAESAIGLGILVAYYRLRGTIAVININLLKS